MFKWPCKIEACISTRTRLTALSCIPSARQEITKNEKVLNKKMLLNILLWAFHKNPLFHELNILFGHLFMSITWNNPQFQLCSNFEFWKLLYQSKSFFICYKFLLVRKNRSKKDLYFQCIIFFIKLYSNLMLINYDVNQILNKRTQKSINLSF